MGKIWIPDQRYETPDLLIPGKKPRAPAAFDKGHPVMQDLRWYWAGPSHDLIYQDGQWKQWSSMTTTLALAAGPSGVCAQNVTGLTSDRIIWNSTPASIDNLTEVTFFIHLDWITQSGNSNVAAHASAGSRPDYGSPFYFQGATDGIAFGIVEVAYEKHVSPVAIIPDGTTNVRLVGTYDGFNVKLFYNGTYVGATPYTLITALREWHGNDVSINEHWGGSSHTLRAYSLGIMGTALNDGDAAMLSDDIYGFMPPP